MLSSLPEEEAVECGDGKINQNVERMGEELRGVIFGKSVRSHFCSLHLAERVGNSSQRPGICREKSEEDDEYDPVVVRLQFEDKDLRSFCRRFLKLE